MTKSRGILAPRQNWTAAEDEILRDLYPDVPCADVAAFLGRNQSGVYQAAKRLGLEKSAYFKASDMSGRVKRGQQDPRMAASRFKPGAKPWNKGSHYIAGGRSAETRFKKGAMSGAAQHNWVPVGTYRINGEGILDQKITDLGRGPRDWEAVHRLVWKAANGPIPPNHVIAFKPGKKTTVLEQITIDAIECISRGDMLRRNSFWNKNPEIARLYQLKGQITRQVNRIQKASKPA
jgi:hypothetical protein